MIFRFFHLLKYRNSLIRFWLISSYSKLLHQLDRIIPKMLPQLDCTMPCIMNLFPKIYAKL